jgi:hypothetical protein
VFFCLAAYSIYLEYNNMASIVFQEEGYFEYSTLSSSLRGQALCALW